jgi:blue copper oxidase
LPVSTSRRQLLHGLGALGLAAIARPGWPDRPASADLAADFCTTGDWNAQPLWVPGNTGFLGRIAPRGELLTLTAGPGAGSKRASARGPLAYAVRHRGRPGTNPTLVWQRGERVRIDLVNATSEPTITHWHGLAVDTKNDGNGTFLVPPGERYRYEFDVLDRGGMYWYHPHPHGLTASQTYRGLYGAILVEDDDERALRAALDLVPGRTEVPLVLQDRRSGTAYAPTPADLAHGFLGDDLVINGAHCGYFDVATRLYRFRILNATNARTLKLAFRTARGTLLPFALLGNDGGLLEAPIRCEQLYLSTAERVDVAVDLSGAAIGDFVRLETLAFDPMHAEIPGAPPADHAATGHAAPAAAGDAPPAGHEHRAPQWPEGAPRALLELRVKSRTAYDRTIPTRLSSLPAIDTTNATERSFRLGFAKGRWRINDRIFEMGMPPVEVRRGTTETWLIRNYHASMPHPMHLHAFHFEVLARETSPDPVAGLALDRAGRLASDFGRKDTVLVWPGESVRVAIDFTHPFPGPQSYLFHCHNLEHEDGGMMLPVVVA